MWITIPSDKPSEKERCERCGSDRVTSKSWTETHETYSGTKTVECSQIICTNVQCQKVFDEKLQAEDKKRADLQKVKLEKELERKKLRTVSA